MIALVLGCAIDGSPLCGATLTAGERLTLDWDLQAHVNGGRSSFDVAHHIKADLHTVSVAGANAKIKVHFLEAVDQDPHAAAEVHPWQGHRYVATWDGATLSLAGGRLTERERLSAAADLQNALTSAGVGLPPASRSWTAPPPGTVVPLHLAPWLGTAQDEVGPEGGYTYVGRRDGVDLFQLHFVLSEVSGALQSTMTLDGPVEVNPTNGRVIRSAFDGKLDLQPLVDQDGTVPAGQVGGAGPMVWRLAVERR